MSYLGNDKINVEQTIVCRGLDFVDVTDADVRTGTVSIGSDGKRIIGNSTQRFIESGTSDATATYSDINPGKIAYSKGHKLSGTYADLTVNNFVIGTNSTMVAGEDITIGDFVKFINVYDSSTAGTTIGTSTEFNTNRTNTDMPKLVKVTDNLLVYLSSSRQNNSTELRIFLYTVVDNTITLVDNIQFYVGAINYANLVNLGNDKLVLFHTRQNTNYTYARVVNISNNTLTLGGAYQISTDNIINLDSVKINDNKILVTYLSKVSNVAYTGYAQILNIIGEVITYGSPVEITTNGMTNINLIKLQNNKFIFGHIDGSSNIKICIININNDIITYGTMLSPHQGDSALYMSMSYISSTKILLMSSHSNVVGNNGKLSVLTISGNDVTDSATVTPFISNLSYYIKTSPAPLFTNTIMVAYNDNTNGYIAMLKINNDDTIIADSSAPFRFSIGNTRIHAAISLLNNRAIIFFDTGSSTNTSILLLQYDRTSKVFNRTISSETDSYTSKVYKLSDPTDNINGVAKTSGVRGSNITVVTP